MYTDNKTHGHVYLSPGTIASLGLPWTGDPTGFTPPPSWDYGAFFDASCNAAMIDFAKQEFENYLKRVQGDRQDENKIAQKYGLNTVTLMLNLTVPLDNKWYYHDPDDKGNEGSNPPTKEEADEHYMNGHGKPMYVDLSKVDLSFLDPTDFNEKKWTTKVVQTLGRSKDGKVFGHITLTYLGNNQVRATTGYDDYDFEMHPWSNPGSWIRNIETIIGEPGQGTGFRIYLIGTGTISPLPQWRQNAYQMINQFESYFSPYK